MTEQPRVLIVDDDPHICRVLSFAFQRAGYGVSCAGTAREAFAAAPQADAAIVDLYLPDQDGCSVCRELKARRPTLRIVVLTGRCSTEDRRNALAAGADEFMTKPCRLKALEQTVARLIGEGPSSALLSRATPVSTERAP